MTLGVGDNVAKLAKTWADGVGTVNDPPEIVQGEAYHQFEVLELEGDQGSPEGFSVKLKLVK